MQRIYLDTEFTSLTLQRKLISLALVSTCGAECYVELTEGWSLEECSDFVHQTVLPLLEPARFGLPRTEAAQQVRRFLQERGPAEIIGDALHWDWPLLIDLLAPGGLPANILGCREVDNPLTDVAEQDVPHHALLDARLLRARCEAALQLPENRT